MSVIHPSEVVNAIVATRFIQSSALHQSWCKQPLRVLCYFSEVGKVGREVNFSSFADLSSQFDATIGSKDALADIFEELCAISTVDELSGMLGGTRTVMVPSSSMSFNNLSAPSLVTPNSSLGIYLRQIMAKWECLQFEDLCGLVQRLRDFLRHPASTKNQEACRASNVNGPFRLINQRSRHVTSKHDTSGDVHNAEEAVHWRYDHVVGELRSPQAESKGSKGSTARALQALQHSGKGVSAAVDRHQHALLQLADMWMRVGNVTMAMSAIEEALKTAHQQGDHTTVAHALLLLFEVFQGSHDPELMASAEDILMRCSVRCAALNLQHLTAQCALLLAALRSRQPLRSGNPYPESCAAEKAGGASPHAAAVWSASQLWTQTHFALLGEIGLSRQVVTARGITEDTEFTQSAPSANPMLSHLSANNAAKKENLQDVPMDVSRELMDLSVQACVLSASLWRRLGMLSMAEFACRRGLRMLSRVVHSVESMVALCAQLLVLRVDLACSLRAAKAGAVLSNLKSVLALGKEMKRSLCGSNELSIGAAQQLETALVYVLYHTAVESGDHAKALCLASRMVVMTAPSPNTTRTVSFSAAPDPPHIEPVESSRCMTEEHYRARLVLVEATSRFDTHAAQMMLVELGEHCRLSGNPLWAQQCSQCASKQKVLDCEGADCWRSALALSYYLFTAFFGCFFGIMGTGVFFGTPQHVEHFASFGFRIWSFFCRTTVRMSITLFVSILIVAFVKSTSGYFGHALWGRPRSDQYHNVDFGCRDSYDAVKYQPFNPFSSRNRNAHIHWLEADLLTFYEFVERQDRLTANEELECGKALTAWRAVETVMEEIYTALDSDCSSSFIDKVTERTGINATTLCTLARDADVTMKRLVDCNLKLVLGVVSRYRSADIPNSELIAEGSRGLARAAERYDFTKGFRFATYATWYVHQGIASYIKARQHLAKMPTVYSQMRRRIKIITDDYHNETGNSPTVKYLAGTLKRTPFDVIKVLSMNKYPTLLSTVHSNDRKIGSKSKHENRERTREESLQSHSPQPSACAAEHNSEQCMRDLLHLCLTAEERGILQSRLGISDGRIKPFKDVGSEFDISWRQVRTLEKTALCKLKESAEVSVFAESYRSA